MKTMEELQPQVSKIMRLVQMQIDREFPLCSCIEKSLLAKANRARLMKAVKHHIEQIKL